MASSGPAKIRAKSLSYIRDARVTVVQATPGLSQAVPTRPSWVSARVRGHQAIYLITGEARGEERRWRCDCREELQRTPAEQCAHAAAVALAVGWPSGAAARVVER